MALNYAADGSDLISSAIYGDPFKSWPRFGQEKIKTSGIPSPAVPRASSPSGRGEGGVLRGSVSVFALQPVALTRALVKKIFSIRNVACSSSWSLLKTVIGFRLLCLVIENIPAFQGWD